MRSLNHLAMIYISMWYFFFWSNYVVLCLGFGLMCTRLLDFFQKQRLLVLGLVIDHLYTIGPFNY